MSRRTERRRPAAAGAWVVPLPVRLLLVLLTAGVGVYLVSLLPPFRPQGRTIPLFDLYLKNSMWPLFAVLVLWRAVRVRAERLAWSFLAAAVTAGATGSFTYYAFLQFRTDVAFPSVSDASWLLLYPLAYVGVVLLLRSRAGRLQGTVWLDALLAAFAGGSLAALVLIGPLLQLGSHRLLPALTGLAYPISDLLLLMMMTSVVAVFGWRPGRTWTLLGAGFAVQAVSDSTYAVALTEGTWRANTVLDAGWPIPLLLIALAAWQPPTRHVSRPVGLTDLVAPAAFALLSVAVLFVATVRDVPLVVSLLALAGVLTSITRTAVTFRQVRDLTVFRNQARTDELTGLANRRRFTEALGSLLETDGPPGLSVLLIDLDRFKEVNDSLGHAAGDELLVEVGRRFAAALRCDDLLARLGGDEFAVLVRTGRDTDAQHVADHLSAALAAPFVLSGVRVHVGASVGLATACTRAVSAAELLRRADVAMYRAKADRCGTHLYADDLDEHSRDRLRLVDELRTGIAQGQLVLHYQPKIALGSGRLTGVEALVRWQHPVRGLLGPDAFLPLVQDAGLSADLSAQVLRVALRDCAAWRAAGWDATVAVNLSTSELLDLALPQEVAHALAEVGLSGSALVVEITEGVFMVDKATSVAVLTALRDQGVRVSVDDYGTGYSSLAYLRELPLDELKLDRSFTQNLDADARTAAIVESTIALSHSLGLAMVAEGVENDAVLDRLRTAGCDLAQGYHVSRPLPVDALRAWFATLDADRAWHAPQAGAEVRAGA
ncbi:putative bifunctional diguanylate cyclase/phosphodiesterase [Kineococcus rhizosphaerae]|uniref:Diguanylate cyclase/phosphodiesterase n=1 Tax=Kineococcus rhizosphaerae TaxID=559628 RepID=A0A2T0R6J1_9ACTN|nr:EAL domain-containing protein [Kineococcus rhizosphaerae]PRY16786.1 diguanylate cyclase/phosphodiesterase [Kineococcus rhizosphaerae]